MNPTQEAAMDERRFRAALEAITETIEGYGEETIFTALATVADRFGWELTKRDPGTCCDYSWYYESKGVMAPMHDCPSPAPDAWVDDLDGPARTVANAFLGRLDARDEFGNADTMLGLNGR